MLIEEYFHEIEQAIAQSSVIIDTQLVSDRRSLYIGCIEGTLLFRYDMAPHHRNVRTFPNHKHLANGQVVEAAAPSCSDVLEKIECLVI